MHPPSLSSTSWRWPGMDSIRLRRHWISSIFSVHTLTKILHNVFSGILVWLLMSFRVTLDLHRAMATLFLLSLSIFFFTLFIVENIWKKIQKFEIWSQWKILLSTGVWQVPEAKFIQEICVLIYLTYTKFQASKIIFVMSGTFQRSAKFIVADCNSRNLVNS